MVGVRRCEGRGEVKGGVVGGLWWWGGWWGGVLVGWCEGGAEL